MSNEVSLPHDPTPSNDDAPDNTGEAESSVLCASDSPDHEASEKIESSETQTAEDTR